LIRIKRPLTGGLFAKETVTTGFSETITSKGRFNHTLDVFIPAKSSISQILGSQNLLELPLNPF